MSKTNNNTATSSSTKKSESSSTRQIHQDASLCGEKSSATDKQQSSSCCSRKKKKNQQLVILNGRGSSVYNNLGNKLLRDYVSPLVHQYMDSNTPQYCKINLVEQVIRHFEEKDIPFLKKATAADTDSSSTTVKTAKKTFKREESEVEWVQLNRDEVRKKVSHLFRDFVRKEKQKGDNESVGSSVSASSASTTFSKSSTRTASPSLQQQRLPHQPADTVLFDKMVASHQGPHHSVTSLANLLIERPFVQVLQQQQQQQSRGDSSTNPLPWDQPTNPAMMQECAQFFMAGQQQQQPSAEESDDEDADPLQLEDFLNKKNVSDNDATLAWETLDQELTLLCVDEDVSDLKEEIFDMLLQI